jgi:amino acid permease
MSLWYNICFELQLLLRVNSIVLLPLCLLKDLSPLRYTSIAGIVGTLYTAAVMALRYVTDVDLQHIEHVFAVLVDRSDV